MSNDNVKYVKWSEAGFELASAQARQELQRFAAQLDFAQGLCELHPEKASAWHKLVARAAENVQAASGRGSLSSLRKAVRDAEKLLAPIGKIAKTYTIYCAGHAHIDMNWMWSWPETVAVTNDTFSTVLRLMEQYPDFCFTQSQASVYAIVEEHHPEMLARIRERVAEGRWEVAASHWVENDKNMVGGEALCRHLLCTRRYMQKLFGLKPEDVKIDWSPDTFGHAATVPSYLVRGGVTRYYCCRPGQGSERPEAFWWQAPDGSRVLVYRPVVFYNGVIEPQNAKLLLEFAKKTGLRAWLNVYGVGDHGGGPTRRDIERAHEMNTWPIFPNFKLSTTRPFYEALERAGDKLPTVSEELNFEFHGCYTSQSLIKKINRYAETQLAAAETAAAFAARVCGYEYPAEKLRAAWHDTLLCHFHDILPGSGVHDTRTYAHGLFQKTAALTGMTETQALRRLAARVDTSRDASHGQPTARLPVAHAPVTFLRDSLGAGVGFNSSTGQISGANGSCGSGARPFLVFNPCATARVTDVRAAHATDVRAAHAGVVVAALWDNDPAKAWDHRRLGQIPFAVRTPSGKQHAVQVLDTGDYWGHMFAKVAFPLESVPGFGYGVYTITEEKAEPVPGGARFCPEHFRMANDAVEVEIDPKTGGICYLFSTALNQTFVDPAHPASVLEFVVERPHGMSAWCLAETGPITRPEVLSVNRKHHGPLVTSVEVKLRINESNFTLTYELWAGEDQVRINLDGTWLERGSPERGVPALRIAFPTTLADAKARYEIPFGAVDRSDHAGNEVVALRWAQVNGTLEGKPASLLLLNDSKHGHALDGSTLKLTLIRSSYDPDPLPEIGRHEIRLALVPSAGQMPVAAAMAHADAYVNPLRVVGTDVHKGPLALCGQFLAVEPENVAVSSVKQAEDGGGLVVRCFETAGKAAQARITVDEKLLGTVREAIETDILERPLPNSSAKVRGNQVDVAVPAHGIATVVVRLA